MSGNDASRFVNWSQDGVMDNTGSDMTSKIRSNDVQDALAADHLDGGASERAEAVTLREGLLAQKESALQKVHEQ